MNRVTTILSTIGMASLGAFLGLSWSSGSKVGTIQHAAQPTHFAQFGLCHTGGGTNCVVDGDTAWVDGEKVRIADIDAPETHDPRCSSELALGQKATIRMQQLLNAGSFTMKPIDRDEDRYGRKLRVLVRDGESLGERLVQEGLARHYDGGRRPWC